MDIAWIPIFVLTLTECVAPPGKTVCQQQEIEMQFLTRAECEAALEQLITLKDASETVIVEKERSSCTPSAREHSVFASLQELIDSTEDPQSFRIPDIDETTPGETRKQHEARLEKLATCEQTNGVAPCKIGEIIIEDATEGEPVEVWRRKD